MATKDKNLKVAKAAQKSRKTSDTVATKAGRILQMDKATFAAICAGWPDKKAIAMIDDVFSVCASAEAQVV